jgi:hypothetical protein
MATWERVEGWVEKAGSKPQKGCERPACFLQTVCHHRSGAHSLSVARMATEVPHADRFIILDRRLSAFIRVLKPIRKNFWLIFAPPQFG